MSNPQSPEISKLVSKRMEQVDSSDVNGSPSQKQDALERRRLQNRLSQRNHRRKIRDRIAKLQERVIASELRAAASLHQWDQRHQPLSGHTSLYDFEKMSSSPVPEASFPLNQPYIPLTGVCLSCNSALCQIPLIPPAASTSASSLFDGSTEFDASTTSSSSLPCAPPPQTPRSICSDGSIFFPGSYQVPMNPSNISDPINFPPQPSSSSLYDAPAGSSTRPRAIVLIPQDTTTSQHKTLPASGSPGVSVNPSDLGSLNTNMNIPNVCLCPGSSSPTTGSWMVPTTGTGAGTGSGTGTGAYATVCPLHRPQWLSHYQVMML